MSCAAITHEILHVLGLWDEYLEQNREPNHDCRVVQKNTMLSDYGMQWNNVFSDKRDDSVLEPSLLYPSHFQSILYGNCSLRNDVKLYRRCSRLSYQISSYNNSACLAEKAYCDRQNVIGRDKVVEQQRINDEVQNLRLKLDELDTRLEINPKPPEDDPDYSRKMSIRSTILSQQRIHQQKISDLQTKLDIISAWPDPLTP